MYADSLLPGLETLARRAAEACGVEVAWIELKRQGGSYVFRVFIERRDGNVGLADCERVGERLGLLLDVEDPIDSSYTLEVSTPGLDRPLRNEGDYERFKGRLASLRTKQAINGKRRFVGRLGGVRSGSVLLEDEERGAVSLPYSAIERGRLEVELDVPAREPRKRPKRRGGSSSGSAQPSSRNRSSESSRKPRQSRKPA
jgi:ribosome maturation factor RimP